MAPARQRALADAGAEIGRRPGAAGRVDVAALASRLAREEITMAAGGGSEREGGAAEDAQRARREAIAHRARAADT